MEFDFRKSKATVVIAGINIVIFIGLTMIGMTEDAYFMLSKGAIYAPYITEYGEYYRLFTGMFLHFGIQHLGNNMLLLIVVGSQFEREIGTIKFVIIYIIAGLGGNVLSLMSTLQTGNYTVSAGASGAIFGIIGGMLWIVIRNKGQVGTMTSRGLIVMIALSLYLGYTGSGIDNLAHIGGLGVGFVLSSFLYWKPKRDLSAYGW